MVLFINKSMSKNIYDVIIVGGGAAGLMCAQFIGQQGLRVLVLEKSNKVGKKILMSGGGRCNFTNLDIQFNRYLSHNPHFCKSALSRYTQWDFIDLVNRHGIEYYEKTLGQLFCCDKSRLIVDLLLDECAKGCVEIKTKAQIQRLTYTGTHFSLKVDEAIYQAKRVVIASGGLSIPTLGGSGFGYEVARQFGHHIYPTRAGLVPLTLHEKDKSRFQELPGISCEVDASCQEQLFRESMLFTHRGLSGPAILQLSSYWQPGQEIDLCLYPDLDIVAHLKQQEALSPHQTVKTALSMVIAKRVVDVLIDETIKQKKVAKLSDKELLLIDKAFHGFKILPNGTEGYRTAEVTLGGVDCDEVSSKTFESQKQSGLYFIGEVLDVTGWLGGYNFQWAWSSAYACADAITTAN